MDYYNKYNTSCVKNCCGCGACKNVCPKEAIKFTYNKYGQCVPEIDRKSCIKCRKCRSVCIALRTKYTEPVLKSGYIAANKNETQLLASSSGGISAAMASKWIYDGGFVSGAAIVKADDNLVVKHILIDKEEDIPLIQGSKYVQSSTIDIFPVIKDKLSSGHKVLFFGTSCQVSSLKLYLGRDYSTLMTCDLICHGVIGQGMFSTYISYLKQKTGIDINRIQFRSKEHKPNYCFVYSGERDGEKKEGYIPNQHSGYYRMFLSFTGYRPCCYSCQFANINKPSDLTLGDYYEANKDYPELFKDNRYSLDRGVSSVLVHTKKGHEFLAELQDYVLFDEVDVNKIIASHPNLQKSSSPKRSSSFILLIYRVFGWSAVENIYRMTDRLRHRPSWL